MGRGVLDGIDMSDKFNIANFYSTSTSAVTNHVSHLVLKLYCTLTDLTEWAWPVKHILRVSIWNRILGEMG
jgi:hypothetical protein